MGCAHLIYGSKSISFEVAFWFETGRPKGFEERRSRIVRLRDGEHVRISTSEGVQ